MQTFVEYNSHREIMEYKSRKVLIVEDQVLFAKGLKTLLEEDAQIEVTSIQHSCDNLVETIFHQKVEVLFLDLNLPGKNGIDVLSVLRLKYPKLVIAILTMYNDENIVNLTRKKGANAFLSKDASIEELIHVVFNIEAYDFYLGRSVKVQKEIKKLKADKFDKFALITSREKEVIKHIAKGLSGNEIASILNISPATVHTHRKNIFNKLKINKISELIRDAYEHHII